MPSIDGASIRKILDSRGNATIAVEIRAGNMTGRAAAPSGASTGTHEPRAFPEGGVDAAIRIFRESVGPGIKSREVSDQAGLDRTLREIDGTRNFARIGCNVATAVSLASAKAAAAASGQPLFRYLGGRSRLSLPLPLGNVIGGGRHCIWGTRIQKFIVGSHGFMVLAHFFTNAGGHGLLLNVVCHDVLQAD